jgi:cbb3-type cytochrome oxidase maturation protein
MSLLVWMVPLALIMGLVGLLAFLWSMKSGQLEDLDGAAERILLNEGMDAPLPNVHKSPADREGAQ